MICKYYLIVSAISALCVGGACAEQPTKAQMSNVADALGSGSADFEICGESVGSKRVRQRFKTAIITCDNADNAMNVFDMAYANRLNAFASQGGACSGNIKARLELFYNQIQNISDLCDE